MRAPLLLRCTALTTPDLRYLMRDPWSRRSLHNAHGEPCYPRLRRLPPLTIVSTCREGRNLMSSSDSDHVDTPARALETALARIGEPITEALARKIAALEDCGCKEGMFALATSRRALLSAAGAVAATGAAAVLPRPANAET